MTQGKKNNNRILCYTLLWPTFRLAVRRPMPPTRPCARALHSVAGIPNADVEKLMVYRAKKKDCRSSMSSRLVFHSNRKPEIILPPILALNSRVPWLAPAAPATTISGNRCSSRGWQSRAEGALSPLRKPRLALRFRRLHGLVEPGRRTLRTRSCRRRGSASDRGSSCRCR